MTANNEETKSAWIVTVNSDLTEGKGFRIVKAVCEIEATAIRLARKADVQGTDGHVRPVTLVKKGSEWYGPVSVEYPTRADEREQKRIEARRVAKHKAMQAGLTAEDIGALRD